ncbi:MAG: Kelch repeat-containing protein [Chloroflexota bacterium]
MITDPLSEREREILRLVALGATNQRIAHELVISINTVKVHVRNVFTKIGVNSRAEAALYAVRVGLVQADGVPAGLAGEDVRAARTGADGAVTYDALTAQQSVTGPGLTAAVPQGPSGLRAHPLAAITLAMVVVVAIILFLTQSTWLPITPFEQPRIAAATPVGSGPRWRELASLPTGRAAFALASFTVEGRSFLYAIGGDTTVAVVNEVLRYDPANNAWAPMSPKPTATADVRAAVLGNKVYVPGGRLADGRISTQMEAYDPQRDLWLQLAPMPVPRSGYALAVFEGKLFVIGGWDGSTYRTEVWQYNPDDDSWRTRTPMPTARAYAVAVSLEHWIYVVGGEDASGPLALNQRYSPADDGAEAPWATKAPSLAPLSRGDAAAIGGLVMMAGLDNPGGHLAIYSQQTDTWRTSEMPLSPLRDLRAQAIGNKLYLIGGRTGGIPTKGAFEYQVISTVFLPAIR